MVRSDDFVVSLHNVESDDIAFAGERAASFGGLFHNGFPIIQGFVVTSNAYGFFLQAGNLKKKINHLLGSINFDNQASLLQVSSHIQKLIQKSKVPKLLAEQIFSFYESIGKNSYVLIQQSNMECFLSKKYFKTAEIFKGDAVVMDAIRKIWSSCYIPSALLERYENGFIQTFENCSIIVTNVLDATASGIAKTVNNENVVVTAEFGHYETDLGFDMYTIQKNEGVILGKTIARQEEMYVYKKGLYTKTKVAKHDMQKQKISDVLILSLARLAKEAEQTYYFPQIIEWICVKDKIYVKARYEYTPPVEDNLSEASEIIAVFPGIGIGKIVHVNDPKDFLQIKRGHVVVTSLSIDKHLSDVKRASGLILKKYSDRLASVIRVKNLGVPTVALKSDTENQFYLRNDTIVTLDGTTGSILNGSILV